MTRIRFQQSLEDLKENLLVMAGLAEQAIQRAIEAYRVRDLSICDLVNRSEIAINRMERDIDQAALDLLAMEQPMAIDLRFILSVIKINADLERVGDAAKSISDRVRIMDRMATVDRNVLRGAVAEFLGYPATPRAVVINEALEIARKFSTPESVQFINGVLDSVGKEVGT